MPSDRYTKAVLTVIAATLVWICVRDLAPVAQAREQSVSLTYTDRSPLPVKIVGVEHIRWTEKRGLFDTVQLEIPFQDLTVVVR